MSALTDEEILEIGYAKDAKYNGMLIAGEDLKIGADQLFIECIKDAIAANNAKVLKDLKPVGFLDQFNCFYTFRHPEMRTREMFSADQFAALVQERDALKAVNASRQMFVARLQDLNNHQSLTTIADVFALINDCDMLAQLQRTTS